MVRTRSLIYSIYILLLDKSLLFHERFISRRSLGVEISDSTIASNKGIAIDAAYDEMVSELLDEFPILGWRTYLFTCLNDEIVVKNNSAVTNTTTACREVYKYSTRKRKFVLNCLNDEIVHEKNSAAMNTFITYRDVYRYNTFIALRSFYYYGLHGQVHDQALICTKFPNTRGMFLTTSLKNGIEESSCYVLHPNSMSEDPKVKNQTMKLIEHCRIENNGSSSSFFDNTLREIVLMDYLLTQRRRIIEDNIMRGSLRNWFTTNVYKAYAKDEINVLSI